MGTVDFRIWQKGRERSLFTIKESRRDQSLILLPHLKFSDFGDGNMRTIRELHVTAHTERMHGDPPRPAHKFKTTATDSNGRIIDRSVIVSTSRKGAKLLWPLTTALCGDLGGDFFDSQSKSGTVVQLCAYEPVFDCLLYSVYIHDKSVNLGRMQGFGSYTHEFSQLNATIFISFVHMKPDASSRHNFHIDGSMRIDGKAVTQQAEIQTSIHSRRLEAVLQQLNRDAAVAFLVSSSRLSRWRAEQILRDEARFSRWPSYGTPQVMTYGELARLKGEVYHSPNFVRGQPKPAGYVEHSLTHVVVADEPTNE